MCEEHPIHALWFSLQYVPRAFHCFPRQAPATQGPEALSWPAGAADWELPGVPLLRSIPQLKLVTFCYETKVFYSLPKPPCGTEPQLCSRPLG